MKTTIFFLVLNIGLAIATFPEWNIVTWLNGFVVGLGVMDLACRIAKRFDTPEDAA